MSRLPGREGKSVTMDRLVSEYARVYDVLCMSPSIEELSDLDAYAKGVLLAGTEKIRYSEFGRKILYPVEADAVGLMAFRKLEATMGGRLLRIGNYDTSLLMVLPNRDDPLRVPTRGKTFGLSNGSLAMYDQDVVVLYSYRDHRVVSRGPLIFSGVNNGWDYIWFGMEYLEIPSHILGSVDMRYNSWIQSGRVIPSFQGFFNYVYDLVAHGE